MKKNWVQILMFVLLTGLLAGLTNSALAYSSRMHMVGKGTLTGNEKRKLYFTLTKTTDVTIYIRNASKLDEFAYSHDYYINTSDYQLKYADGKPVFLDHDVYCDANNIDIGYHAYIRARLPKGNYYYELQASFTNGLKKEYTYSISAGYISTISPKSKILIKGETFTPTVEYADDLIKKWSSSNTKVATVTSNGKIKAVGSGTAVISCKLDNDATLKTKVTVYSINSTKTNLFIGAKTKLKISGTSKKVTWKSSNTKVATVNSNGVVKAIKKGTATITAKVNGKTLKCVVAVNTKPKMIPATAVMYKGLTLQLNLRGAGSSKVKWSVNNTARAKVNNKGLVTAKQAGKITVTAECFGKKYKAIITIKTPKWSAWSDWSPKKYTATSKRQVETKTGEVPAYTTKYRYSRWTYDYYDGEHLYQDWHSAPYEEVKEKDEEGGEYRNGRLVYKITTEPLTMTGWSLFYSNYIEYYDEEEEDGTWYNETKIKVETGTKTGTLYRYRDILN